MNLTVVIPVLGQPELSKLCIDRAVRFSSEGTKIVVIDQNGGLGNAWQGVEVLNPGKNIGVYPTFKYGMENTDSDVVLFIHSDLIIDEDGYDYRLLAAFEADDNLGLVGFVGSNEIDSFGGRGGGTTSNFQGNIYNNAGLSQGEWQQWIGSPASAHGMTNSGITKAAVVDGCAMAIRRAYWNQIGYRADFPIHHFYDRLISTQMLEAGYGVAVLGIACDHISGQTVSREQGYQDIAEQWSRENVNPENWAGNPPNYAWDQTIYQEAERRWLAEYRDTKHVVPVKV